MSQFEKIQTPFWHHLDSTIYDTLASLVDSLDLGLSATLIYHISSAIARRLDGHVHKRHGRLELLLDDAGLAL